MILQRSKKNRSSSIHSFSRFVIERRETNPNSGSSIAPQTLSGSKHLLHVFHDAKFPQRLLALVKYHDVLRVQVIEFSSTQNNNNRANHDQFPLHTVAPLILRDSSGTKWATGNRKSGLLKIFPQPWTSFGSEYYVQYYGRCHESQFRSWRARSREGESLLELRWRLAVELKTKRPGSDYLPEVLPSAHTNFASRTQNAIAAICSTTYFPSPTQKPPTWVG